MIVDASNQSPLQKKANKALLDKGRGASCRIKVRRHLKITHFVQALRRTFRPAPEHSPKEPSTSFDARTIPNREQMIYEFKGVCRHCATEVSVLIHNARIVGNCPDCTNEPFLLSAVEGIVYVVTNPHQSGVKIGITTKTVEERIKGLNSTGVAGSFRPVAIFPSNSPKKHEKKVHEKLIKVRIEKEHFDLEPIDAVLKIYRILNKSISPIFYSDEDQDTFNKRLELDRITMELKLKGQKAK